MLRYFATISIAALVAAVGFGVSGFLTGAAEANPPYKTIVICYQGETIEVPLWKYKAGDYPGATEGPCPEETTTTPPPTTTDEVPPPTTTDEASPPPSKPDKPKPPPARPNGPEVNRDLPYTGSEAWLIAAAGLAIAAAGALLFWFGRERP